MSRRPKGKYDPPDDRAYIWTRDQVVKAHEPRYRARAAARMTGHA
jgi:hypothetical protein